jgi:protein subunit release factor B
MAYRSNQQQLREDVWDYRDRPSSRERENVLRFPRSDEEDHGETALDLVHQAAELFDSMESHAREQEANAQSLCKSLAEKLVQAERQREAAERARLETITELNRRLQEATRALNHAEKRVESAEDYATAAEFRAQAAENQLFKANRELAAVEEAIRTRLL